MLFENHWRLSTHNDVFYFAGKGGKGVTILLVIFIPSCFLLHFSIPFFSKVIGSLEEFLLRVFLCIFYMLGVWFYAKFASPFTHEKGQFMEDTNIFIEVNSSLIFTLFLLQCLSFSHSKGFERIYCGLNNTFLCCFVWEFCVKWQFFKGFSSELMAAPLTNLTCTYFLITLVDFTMIKLMKSLGPLAHKVFLQSVCKNLWNEVCLQSVCKKLYTKGMKFAWKVFVEIPEPRICSLHAKCLWISWTGMGEGHGGGV